MNPSPKPGLSTGDQLRRDAMAFARLGLLCYTARDVLVHVDACVLDILDLEKAFSRVSDLVGQPLDSLFQKHRFSFPSGEQTEETGNFRDQQEVFCTSAGEQRWIRYDADFNPADQIYRVIVRDVTAQHCNQERLALSEEQYRLLAEFSQDWIFLMEKDGVTRYVTPACEKITGYTPEEFYRNPHLMSRIIHPEDQAAWDEHVTNWQYERMDPPREFRIVTKAGMTRWIHHSCSLVQNLTSGFTGIQGSNIDVTLRRAAQLELEEANAELVRRNSDLDEFTYMASHDLQEPLRKLSSFCSLLPEDVGEDLPEKARNDLVFIIDAAKRMQTLVADLLALSRAGRKAMKIERRPLDEVVDRALFALSGLVEEMGAEITRCPLPTVSGDPTILTQLYQNLISNALKFTHNEPPLIELTLEEQPDEFILGVKDNGIGIKEENLEHVFFPFKRLHGRNEYDGSGIGLAICRKAMERHGGRIWVESEFGKGSHFRFALPKSGFCGAE